MGCILQGFLREMILKRYKNFNGIDGIAPNAQIFSYKMYSDAGSVRGG